MNRNPPLGIIPLRLWKEQRYYALNEAIVRYVEAHQLIPQEWLNERETLVVQLWADELRSLEPMEVEYENDSPCGINVGMKAPSKFFHGQKVRVKARPGQPSVWDNVEGRIEGLNPIGVEGVPCALEDSDLEPVFEPGMGVRVNDPEGDHHGKVGRLVSLFSGKGSWNVDFNGKIGVFSEEYLEVVVTLADA